MKPLAPVGTGSRPEGWRGPGRQKSSRFGSDPKVGPKSELPLHTIHVYSSHEANPPHISQVDMDYLRSPNLGGPPRTLIRNYPWKNSKYLLRLMVI